MPKKYKRRRLSSMDQLDLEQERIRNRVRNLEDNWSKGLFSPGLVMSAAGLLLNRGKRKLGSGKTFFSKSQPQGAIKNKAKSSIASFFSEPMIKQAAKKIGISFIQWQLFNLALFAGKKIIAGIRNRKKHMSSVKHA